MRPKNLNRVQNGRSRRQEEKLAFQFFKEAFDEVAVVRQVIVEDDTIAK